MYAIISKLLFLAYSFEQTITAAAPSVNGEDVPAVTVPFLSKAGFRFAMDSRDVSGLMHPSLFTSLIVIISSINCPFS